MTVVRHLSERRTEDVALELLDIQGWPTSRPPRGRLVRQNEYKAFLSLEEIFRGKSKQGTGDAYPDFLLIDSNTMRPQLVIETKANERSINEAIEEACLYGDACRESGHSVIAVGIAGQEKTGIRIAVRKFFNNAWEPVVYEETPISWVPTPSDTVRLLELTDAISLSPIVPRPEILASKAEFMNRILREANVKDEYRPAYIGAMMLALWQSQGQLSREPDHVLKEVNANCELAFSIGGKTELAKSLRVDIANTKLAYTAWEILATLEKLNVVAGSVDHDYLGQLYEQFFRYTGGNTIGQYFTPRHITRFMADICETSKDDLVIDPACGTGGFLIACIQRAYDALNIKYEDAIAMIRDNLIGYESEPVTAALCVANMILRGDGKTGIRKDDCFIAEDYPKGECQIALMNPPFPHKQTDVPPQVFVERALEALESRGLLAVILPTSLIVKKDIGEWRARILRFHSLEAVCQLPDELFQPYASTTTSIVVIRKGVPHSNRKKSVFVRLQYDGFTLKKGTRVPRLDEKNDIPLAVDTILNRREEPGFSGLGNIQAANEWSVGAYIPSGMPSDEELKISIDELLRRLVSFYVRYAAEIVNQRSKIVSGDLEPRQYRDMLSSARLENARELPSNASTIGEFFDIYYGQKELHSREGMVPGDTLIISPTEQYNGCYGWLDFSVLIKPPFVTVAQTGTIGEAFVQLEPCGVNDDCLILLPKQHLNLPLACYFIAAATIRLERWRFNYGRKLTPARISDFRMTRRPDLEKWVSANINNWNSIIEGALRTYSNVSDELNAEIPPP
jgi:predicted RNA methylase